LLQALVGAATAAATSLALWSQCIATRQQSSLMKIFGHRGGSEVCPENTRAAFEWAFQHGAAGVECDLQRLADGTIIILHGQSAPLVALCSQPLPCSCCVNKRAMRWPNPPRPSCTVCVCPCEQLAPLLSNLWVRWQTTLCAVPLRPSCSARRNQRIWLCSSELTALLQLPGSAPDFCCAATWSAHVVHQ
jgi:glycerophosphoryl diester phosphodiesterase